MASISAKDLMGDSKKMPLLSLGAAPKIKKEPKTYVFELQLGESTDKTYPEFSWANLVKDAKAKELEEKKKKGTSLLDPYASDDDDDLRAMAARLEEKYGNQTSSEKPSKKKKAKYEEFVDRGAGYDESDSFIDNTDAYDERIPLGLQPSCGGFYINSGLLSSKEVPVSEDSEEEEDDKVKLPKKSKGIYPQSVVSTVGSSTSVENPTKNPVDAKPGQPGVRKGRKPSQDTPLSRPKNSGDAKKAKPNNLNNTLAETNEAPKKRIRQINSSSSSSSSDSSSSGSSGSGSDSSSSSSDSDEKEKKMESESGDVIILESTTPPAGKPIIKSKLKKTSGMTMNMTSGGVTIKPTIVPNRPRMKTVPLNPNLKRKFPPHGAALKQQGSLPPATITARTMVTSNVTNPSAGQGQQRLPMLKNTSLNKQGLSSSVSRVGDTSPISTSPSTTVIRVPTPKSTPNANAASTPISNAEPFGSSKSSSPATPASSISTPTPKSLSAELADLFPGDIVHSSPQLSVTVTSRGESPKFQGTKNVATTVTSRGESPKFQGTKNVATTATSRGNSPKVNMVKPGPLTPTSISNSANANTRVLPKTNPQNPITKPQATEAFLRQMQMQEGVGIVASKNSKSSDVKHLQTLKQQKTGMNVGQQIANPSSNVSGGNPAKSKRPSAATVQRTASSTAPATVSSMLTSYTSSPSSMPTLTPQVQVFPTGSIEVAKVKKGIPSLGSNITVTQLKDRVSSSGDNMPMGSGNLNMSQHQGAKVSSYNSAIPPYNPPVLSLPQYSSSSPYTSVITGPTSSVSSSQGLKLTSSVPPISYPSSTSSLLTNYSTSTTPMSSAGLSISKYLSQLPTMNNSMKPNDNRLPGYFTPFDVNALLSGSSSSGGKPDPKTGSTKSNTNFTGYSSTNTTERK